MFLAIAITTAAALLALLYSAQRRAHLAWDSVFGTSPLIFALQYSAAVRNAQLDAWETAIGTSPILRIYNGTIPATCATALSGNTLLAEGTLPSDWMAAASGGAKAKSGTWTITGQTGASTGTVGTFYRIYASDGTTCCEQGSFTVTGGGGDLTADNASIANAQVVTVSSFTRTAGNA